MSWHPRRVDVADPPFEALRRRPDKAQKVPVPDRAAGHPIVDPDPLADGIARRLDWSTLPHIEVARGEVAQRKDRQPDLAAVNLVDAPEMAGHRRLAALHRRIAKRAAQQLRPHLPRPAGSVDQGQIDPVWFDVAGGERHHSRGVGAGQSDRNAGRRRPRLLKDSGSAGSGCATYAPRDCCPSRAPLSAAGSCGR